MPLGWATVFRVASRGGGDGLAVDLELAQHHRRLQLPQQRQAGVVGSTRGGLAAVAPRVAQAQAEPLVEPDAAPRQAGHDEADDGDRGGGGHHGGVAAPGDQHRPERHLPGDPLGHAHPAAAGGRRGGARL